MQSAVHRLLAGLMTAQTGQQLTNARAWRIDAALRPLLRQLGCADLDALAARIVKGDKALSQRVVEALLNNETSFFRDREVFALIETRLLPRLLDRRDRRLAVWSAGCSTGQEPYSLAMLLADSATVRGAQVRIDATDISEAAIERAKAARYTRFEIQRGLPVRAMLRYFIEDGEEWQGTPQLRRMVRFGLGHVLQPARASYDLVLCRNVLMYFSANDRRLAFDRLADALAPGGVLVLGAGETVLGQTDRFVPDAEVRGVYTKAIETRAAA